MYSEEFEKLVNKGVTEGFYIGTGNPNAKILIVGKEAAIGFENDFEKHNHKNYSNNAKDWLKNIDSKITAIENDWNIERYLSDPLATNNPLFVFKGVKISDHKEGQTWRKYQKLYDIIFNGAIDIKNDRLYNFQENFFLTEMSDAPYRTTSEAQQKEYFKIELEKRRKEFFTSDYVKHFPVIILACGNYIKNNDYERQIDDTFGVRYFPKKQEDGLSYWIHYNDESRGFTNPKLIIHTNQLSGSVASNELLKQIGKTIREFAKLHELFPMTNDSFPSNKSTPEAIRRNFDQQVERFSNIETGQTTAIDSPLCMELVSQAAKLTNPNATRIMDLGCGGGNYAVKVASLLPHVDCTLIDLSKNMVEAAQKRVSEIITGKVTAIQGDYREIELGESSYDIITAGTTLHHLRGDDEWELVFGKIFNALKPGGSFWINDIVVSETDELTEMMMGGWLSILKKQISEEEIEMYMTRYETEDTPRTLSYQLELMKQIGFGKTILLHKHFNFAAYGGIK
jgi:tRNA (cmo5U34)-methyltransferase